MTDTRNCDQCGVAFTPHREHARFCSARCRARWNRRHAGGAPADTSALDWSITAMRETIGRLHRAGGGSPRRPSAACGSSATGWATTRIPPTSSSR